MKKEKKRYAIAIADLKSKINVVRIVEAKDEIHALSKSVPDFKDSVKLDALENTPEDIKTLLDDMLKADLLVSVPVELALETRQPERKV